MSRQFTKRTLMRIFSLWKSWNTRNAWNKWTRPRIDELSERRMNFDEQCLSPIKSFDLEPTQRENQRHTIVVPANRWSSEDTNLVTKIPSPSRRIRKSLQKKTVNPNTSSFVSNSRLSRIPSPVSRRSDRQRHRSSDRLFGSFEIEHRIRDGAEHQSVHDVDQSQNYEVNDNSCHQAVVEDMQTQGKKWQKID